MGAGDKAENSTVEPPPVQGQPVAPGTVQPLYAPTGPYYDPKGPQVANSAYPPAAYAPAVGVAQPPGAHPIVINHHVDNTECWSVDWLMFILGWFFTIPWIVGAFLPLCRATRFRNGHQKIAWILNVVFGVLTVCMWIFVIIFLGIAMADAKKHNPHGSHASHHKHRNFF